MNQFNDRNPARERFKLCETKFVGMNGVEAAVNEQLEKGYRLHSLHKMADVTRALAGLPETIKCASMAAVWCLPQ
jgi:hypothetical protein